MRRMSPSVRILTIVWCILLVWVLAGVFGSRTVQRPSFDVLEKHEGYEVREYPPYLLAQVTVREARLTALDDAAGLLHDYLAGDNVPPSSSVSADETRRGIRIAPAAPVLIQEKSGTLLVSLIMPDSYSAATLPRPNSPEIRVLESPASVVAVRRFTGWTDIERFRREAAVLTELLGRDKRGIVSATVGYAQYDPSWSLPFMRHNEVMLNVRREP